MKYRLKNIKGTRMFFAVLFIAISSLVSYGASPQTPKREIKEDLYITQNTAARGSAALINTSLSDEEQIKAVIDAYFTVRYEGQKSIVAQDFSFLVQDETSEWVKKERDKREIELYIADLFDLGYQSYEFYLDYDSIKIDGDQATVQLRESHQVVFNAIAPEVSYMSNLEHTISLIKEKDGWVISKDDYQDELSSLIDSASIDDIKKQIDENFRLSSEPQDQDPPAINEEVQTPFVDSSVQTFPYYRVEAVYYADTHIPTTDCPTCNYNTDYYVTEYLGSTCVDCTNFVSQALYAGGGTSPPDTKGMPAEADRVWSQTMHYIFNYPPGYPNGDPSGPWYNVTYQWNFFGLYDNKIGPVGTQTYNICYTQIGDIVQLYSTEDGWFHEGMIVSKGYDCRSLQTTLVDAHCDDRFHYPLAHWSSFGMRYIHITGYRSDQVSSFSDVQPTYWAWQEIERLYDSSITGGCAINPLRYCPNNNVTRAQMAVFLLKGKHGSSYTPPPVGTSTGFSDVSIYH